MDDVLLETLLAPILDLYNQIETELLLNVVARFDTYDTVGGTLEWYLRKLQEMGVFKQDNLRIIKESTNLTSKEIKHLLNEVALATSMQEIEMNYDALVNTPANRHILESITNSLENDINVINTKALESADKAYMDTLTKSYIETSSGAYSYQESIKYALVEMAENGIAGATYRRANGKVVQYNLEGTVRRDILTRAHQTAVEVQFNNMRELGHNLVYVSQHIGARTHKTDKIANHAGWQGKVYMLDGSSEKYENLVEATGYGDIRGLAGVNCRHHIRSYIEGVTKLPTRIDETKNERVYQLSQDQRKMERDVRKAKKNLALAKAIGDNNAVGRREAQLATKTEKLNDFVKSHPELHRDYTRTRITEDYTQRAKTTAEKVGVSKEYWDKVMTADERDFCHKFPEPIQWIDRNIIGEDGKVKPSYDFVRKSDGLLYELKTPIKKPKYSNIARTISETVAKNGKNRFVINFKNRTLSDKLRDDLTNYNVRHPNTTIESLMVLSKGKIINIELKK